MKLFNGRPTALKDATTKKNNMLAAMLEEVGYTPYDSESRKTDKFFGKGNQHFLVNWRWHDENTFATLSSYRMNDEGEFKVDHKSFRQFLAEIAKKIEAEG